MKFSKYLILMLMIFFLIIPVNRCFSYSGIKKSSFLNLSGLRRIPVGFLGFFNRDNMKKKYGVLLVNSDWKKRYQAIKDIGSEKNNLRFTYLIEALSDDHVLVSLMADRQLSLSDRKNVMPYLLKSLDSRDPWTRKLCVELLSNYKTPDEVTRQLVFMANDNDRGVKLAAITSLEKISGETLLFDYFPMGEKANASENILSWWYVRGKTIKKSGNSK